METNNEKKSIPQLSVDASVLMNRLRKLEKGETVSYKELSELIKADVQNKARGYLYTARNRLLQDERMVFEAVHGHGLKRMGDADIISVGEAASHRVHNLARRAAKKLACADFEKLTREEKIELNTEMSLLGAINLMTKPSKIAALKEAVGKAEDKLSLGRTLSLFS